MINERPNYLQIGIEIRKSGIEIKCKNLKMRKLTETTFTLKDTKYNKNTKLPQQTSKFTIFSINFH